MAGCDRCSMCCKLIQIAEPTLKKPANVWCTHCTKPGCGIYESRPKACVDYACVWLQSQSEEYSLPESFRPDRCKVIIDITMDGEFAICRVDPNYPHALSDPDMKLWLKILSEKHSIISIVGRQRKILHKTEKGKEILAKMGFSPDDTNWIE